MVTVFLKIFGSFSTLQKTIFKKQFDHVCLSSAKREREIGVLHRSENRLDKVLRQRWAFAKAHVMILGTLTENYNLRRRWT